MAWAGIVDSIARVVVARHLLDRLRAAGLHDADKRLKRRALERRKRQRDGFGPLEPQQESAAVRTHVAHTGAAERVVCRAADNLSTTVELHDSISALVIVIDELPDGKPSRLLFRNQVRKDSRQFEIVGDDLDAICRRRESRSRAAKNLGRRDGRPADRPPATR